MTPPIHLRAARRWRRVRLASQAAAGSVIASAIAWLAGAPSWLHLTAIVVGAAGAAIWPVRTDERRALRWVAAHVGLAYETAWDLSPGRALPPAAPGSERAAALRDAVAVQGRLSVRDLRPPQVAAWWLPMAALALALWAWGALGGSGPLATPTGPAAGPTPPLTSAAAPSDSEPDAPEDDVAAAPEAGVDPATPALGEAAEAPSGGGGAGSGAGGDGGAASERDVLERFLDHLRERPPEAEEERPAEARPLDPVADGEPSDDAADDAMRGASESGPDGDAEPGGQDAGSDGEGTGDEGDAGEGLAGEGLAGEGLAEDDEAGASGGDGEAGGADAPAPEAGGEIEPGPGEGADGGLDEGGEDGSAGIGVGAVGAGDDPAGPAAGETEPLPSILGPGPEQSIGGAQLPGVAPDDLSAPIGRPSAAFERAVEEALNEGELPVPYQDVIRNYFR